VRILQTPKPKDLSRPQQQVTALLRLHTERHPRLMAPLLLDMARQPPDTERRRHMDSHQLKIQMLLVSSLDR